MSTQSTSSEHMPDAQFATMLLSAVASSSRNDGIQVLVNLGRQALGNPIVITDKSWKAIAMTTDIDIPDDVGWNELQINGYLSADTVAAGIRGNLADKIEQSAAPFKWHSADMKYPRLMNRVSLGGKTIATISVVEYCRPFRDKDEALLKILGDAVTAELQKDHFQQFTRGILYENFIENLLEGRLKDPKVIEDRVKLLNIGIKKYVYVFVFDITDFDTKQYTVSYMRDVLEKMISGGQALIHDHKIVIASSYIRAKDIFEKELNILGEFLKKYNIRCGISRRCTQLAELRFYYEQALDALRIGTHLDADRFIYPYGEYAVYHIAESCMEAGGSKTFCHPALLALIAHDQEYGTHFINSLYAYLSHFRNISDAAKALHLHRSTVVYHLRRIEEIMEIHLSDFSTVLLIELSFRILEYEKKLDFRTPKDGLIEKEN
jgi:hypothetical protein